MYRDFIYMDLGRIQSIIAQLQQGVLEKVMEGKSNELHGNAGIAAGVLAAFLPVDLGGGFSRKNDVQSSKVLHDYAFNIALESLDENDLCLEVKQWDRVGIPLPDNAFILVQGSMSIIDYSLLKHLAENERNIDRLLNSRSQPQKKGGQRSKSGNIKQMWTLVEALMGDSLQVKISYSEDIIFTGTLSREYLRENTRDLIFKYGGKQQAGWSMLAQVCQVTEPLDKLKAFSRLTENSRVPEAGSFGATTDVINPVVEMLNVFQEAMASVTYPAIAVTPIALYRELESLR